MLDALHRLRSRLRPARPAPSAGGLALAAGVLVLGSTAPPALASDDAALVIHSRGLDALMPDERDATLRRVMELLPERLLELSTEMRDFPPLPPPVVRSIAAGLMSPMSLSVAFGDAPEPGQPPTVNLLLTVQPDDPAVAESLARLASEFVGQQGATLRPSDVPGMAMTQAPFGTLAIGTQMKGDEATFVLGLNHTGTEVAPVTGTRLPASATSALSVRLDTRQLDPLLEAIAASDPNAREMMGVWRGFGLGGEQGWTMTMAHGYAEDRAHSSIVMEDYAALAARVGAPRDLVIPMDEFRAVPRDAVFVEMNAVRLSGIGDVMQEMMAASGAPDDMMEEIERQVGINPRTDLLDHLGDVVTVYRSDATGGGGLMSLVGLIGLDDAAKVAQTHRKIVRLVNDQLTPQTQGYVSIRPWANGDQTLFTLSFNGVPIPLQITWGIQGSRLIVGGSPMAVIAAMDQISEGRSSIAERPRIVGAAGGELEGLTSFRYVDVPRAAARGYGTASLLTTALANAVRSPRAEAEDRDPGMPMPSFERFIRDVKPIVSAGFWDGDDFVVRVQSDRSVLVSLAGAVESVGGVGGLVIAGASVGALVPALEQAREAAQVARSQAQVRGIVMAMQVHAAEYDGRMPTSLDALVEAEFLGREMLQSPMGPAWDGGPDYAYRQVTMEDNAALSRTMVLIDRAMWVDRYETTVGFADGHVELLGYDELAELLKRPENAGAIEAFGLEDDFS